MNTGGGEHQPSLHRLQVSIEAIFIFDLDYSDLLRASLACPLLNFGLMYIVNTQCPLLYVMPPKFGPRET